MINPGQKWFCWGIRAKKKLNGDPWDDQTYYGAGTAPYWNLGGNGGGIGRNGEKLREQISMGHFLVEKCEVDIYLDADQGVFKLCVVGISGTDKEVFIDGLRNAENDDGWVPHLLFTRFCDDHQQQIRACKIDSECYGKEIEIQWE